MSNLKVLVVGAGLGGLCLAQRLRDAQVDVEVFERDASPWDRPQGYRLHLDDDGINALEESLSPELFALFEATSMHPVDSTTIIDTGLNVRKRVPSDTHSSNKRGPNASGESKHVNVNRATVRQIALTGLDDICHFRATFDHYETDAQGVTAFFADGSKVRGDILVGADGIRSAVRRQRAPELRMMDTNVRAIYGRLPLANARELLPAHVLDDVFTVGSDARKVFLGLGPVIFPTRPELASNSLAPEARLPPQEDYVVMIIGGRREHFQLDDASLHRATSDELQRIAGEMLKEWPKAAAAIPAKGDPRSFFIVEMHTSVPGALTPATRVTLLGDAVHAMTPTLGRGANLAMRDGAMLGRHILGVAEGKTALAEALNAYESEMTRYGFEVVRESAAMGQRLIGQEPLPE
jgi:2-polyprenyl-6-methoxyphenol hydroxylase-like FAD-dependent oxidoreductase